SASRSAGRSCKRMMATSMPSRTRTAEPFSGSRCRSGPKACSPMQEESKVYVIDDDAGMRESLRFLLEARGFKVETYGSARDFLAAGGADRVGCLVVDVRMPEMTGLQLQERLTEQGSRLRLVVITGYGDVAMAVGAMKAGAVDFIEKPFSDEALFDSVDRALKQSRRLAGREGTSIDVGDRLRVLTA